MSEETKEVKIAIPEGYEIDTEKSTFTNIVFKKKRLSWLKYIIQKCHNAYIAGYTISETFVTKHIDNPAGVYFFANKKQAKRARAYALITQIIKNDDRFGGEITDEEWADGSLLKHVIDRNGFDIEIGSKWHCYTPIAFHTYEQRNLFYKENEQLLKDYFMID